MAAATVGQHSYTGLRQWWLLLLHQWLNTFIVAAGGDYDICS